MSQDTQTTDTLTMNASVVDLTAGIVSAYVTNQHVPIGDLPSLIQGVHGALSSAVQGVETATVGGEAAASANVKSPAEIKKSIKKEGLVSFIDGKSYKTLKRHLSTNGMTPEQYKAKFGLPVDYPMVSEDYSKQRSSLAKNMGLGRGGAAQQEAA